MTSGTTHSRKEVGGMKAAITARKTACHQDLVRVLNLRPGPDVLFLRQALREDIAALEREYAALERLAPET